MTAAVVATLLMLAAAAAVTVVRLLRGPSVLDRVVALDMMLSIITCGLATAVAFALYAIDVSVVVVVALMAFIGSATVARILLQERAE